MSEAVQRDWRELYAVVANENDPKKLELLFEELLRALEDRRSQSQAGTRETSATTR
jgi:hypothetical protein